MLIFKPFGPQALLVEWEQRIALDVHGAVMELYQKVAIQNIVGVLYQIPAYCSLTIGFNPELIAYQALLEQIAYLDRFPLAIGNIPTRQLSIPVCYESSFALDMPLVEAQTKLDRATIVRIHTSTAFRVYMLGFLPGFPYLGVLPEELKCDRRSTPSLKIPAQSVGLAGLQTGIYPSDAPGGWLIIGRTPFVTFNPNADDPFLFKVGDSVRFYSISVEEFEQETSKISPSAFNNSK
ncbi:MAG: 5-oxoprolinase subunit PxpB [Saprospiraceae bacterium]|nr:5-oxoprolinase subunit PxpB [Saprospiraceae bacterium]